MLYSKNLWQKYINIDDAPENIANNLTLKTCEIEEIKTIQLPDTIVIWKVKEVSKHPNADKLFVVQVDCGKYWIKQIVTWWENIVNAVDKFVPVALSGTYLSSIDLKIVARSLRWIDSDWMICSKSELGIPEDEDKHWIWILNEDFEDIEDLDVGKALKEKYPWLENVVLDVDNKTLTHRPDLTGHFWLAIELFAIYNFHNPQKIKYDKLKDIFANFDNTSIYQLLDNSLKSSRKIQVNTDKVNTYILLELKNVNVAKSSFYLRKLLYDIWSNPKNNWVDFSNIFMYLTGQPIHFFDADKVEWNIIVRQANDWEEFIDLFGERHILTKDDIVIADEKKILALAGVVWGLNSWVDETTKNILVEIANFDKVSVRKTWVRLWLRTDAQLRFEKDINPLFSLYSLILFLDELKFFKKDLGNWELVGLDWFSKEIYSSKSILDYQSILEKISIFVLWEKREDFIKNAKNILENLQFQFKDGKIIVPFFRAEKDISIVADFAEEVSRIYWYENIWFTALKSDVRYIPFNDLVSITRDLEDIFVRDFHFDQVETYPWVDKSILSLFWIPQDDLMSLQNPTSPEFKYLRSSLLFNLVEVLEKNFRFFDEIKIFDIWKVWYKTDDHKDINLNEYLMKNDYLYNKDFVEKNVIGFVLYRKNIETWQQDLFINSKAYLEALLTRLSLNGKIEYRQFEEVDLLPSSVFHPKKAANIFFNKKKIWYLGQLHPIYYDYFKFFTNSQIVFWQIYIDDLLTLLLQQKKGIAISKYSVLQDQIVYRDLSFVVDVNFEYGKIVDAILKVKWISDVEVFDIYKWKNIPEDKKSLSVKLEIRWDNLTTQEINEILQKAINEVEKIWWKLRE